MNRFLLKLTKTMRKYSIIIISVVLALTFYLLISANSPVEKTNNIFVENNIMWDLYTDMFTNGGIIVYGTGNQKFTENYIELAQRIKSNFRLDNIKIEPDSALTIDESKNFSLLLLGTFNSNSLLNQFKDDFPIELSESQFIFRKTKYNNKKDIVTFVIPNPINPKKYLLVHTGNSETFVSQKLKFELLNDLIIRRNQQTLLTAPVSYDQKGNWWIDDKHIRNYQQNFKILIEDENFKYILKTDDEDKIDIGKISIRNKENLKKLKIFFNGKIKTEKISINIYTNIEDKGLITLNTTLAHIGQNGKDIHVISNDWINGNDFRAVAQVLINDNLGNPKSEFLERGFAMHFSDNWRGKGYKYWAARLFQSENVPELDVLFDKNISIYESDYIVNPLAGAFVDFIIDEFGKDEFISRYAEWEPDKTELNLFKTKWYSYLQSLVDEYRNEIETDRENFKTVIPKFLKGFNFAHEGYDIHNGYLSRTAHQSLEKLIALNVNSIAINPFTSMRNEKKLEPLAFWRNPHTENDQSMIYLAHVAEELGLMFLMKPHIYLHRSWPGGIEMSSDEEWDKFIDGYYRWIRHYAILSEMYNIPILCVGNELSKATLQNEDKWIAMFNKIRKIYSGKLVYGANWGSEFEGLTFWKYLDYIGISNYYPISKEDKPTDKELFDGANRMLDKIEEVQKKYDKPVIFTEAGFRSSTAPWQSSFEKNKKLPDTTFTSQVRAYEVFYKATYQREWLAGIFWWKWPSYLNEGGDPHNDLYSPNFRPTENVIRKWYGKNWK